MSVQTQAQPLAGMRLLDVLASYEDMGYKLVFTSRLLNHNMRVLTEPPPAPPLARLAAVLAEHQLALKASTNDVWLIIKRRPQEATPATVNNKGSPRRRGATTLEEIVVVSSRYTIRHQQDSAFSFDEAMLQGTPRLGQDPLRVTRHLPGVASIGVSAKPHIRGGLQDELLILFNNIELLEPFHLRDFQSVFSTFNPSLVQSMDVYTGGFPARYGNRMSGVMDINTTTGPLMDRKVGGELAVSVLNTSVLLHGNPNQGSQQWVLSGRRGNLDIVTKQVNSTVGDPSYTDWFTQLRTDLGTNAELDVGLIYFADDISLRDFDTDGETADSSYDNLYGWAQLHWQPRSNIHASSIFYAGDIKHHRNGYLVDEDLDNGEARVDDRRQFQLFSLGQNLHIELDKTTLELGLRLTYQRGRYDYTGNIRRGELATFLGLPEQVNRRAILSPSGASGGAYGSVRWRPRDKLHLQLGWRWDFQNYLQRSGRNQFSPRLSVRYDVSDHAHVRLSAGRFYQPEGIHELPLGDGVNEYQQPQYADHIILGWQQKFANSGFSLRAELFHKRFHDPKRRFENLFNPLVLLPELASDRVEFAPSKARARGAELILRYQTRKNLHAWFAVSQVDVEDYINGRWQPRIWDQGASISSGIQWDNGSWAASAAIVWHDGWRTTRLPAFTAPDQSLALDINGHRLRNHVSLDLRAARTWQWSNQSLSVFLEITNALSRKNVGGIEYDVSDIPSTSLLEITSEEETLLPLVPSLGVSWRF